MTPDTQGRPDGTVTLAERLGTGTVVDVELTRDGRVIAALGQDASLAPSAGLLLGCPPARSHLFPAA